MSESPLTKSQIADYVSSLVPSVLEKTTAGERSYDIFSRLLKDRIVFIGDEVSDHLANLVVAQLLYLNSSDPNKDVKIYINSPGGSITAGLAMLDTMNFIDCDCATYVIGEAASMGAVLLAGGKKGKRFSLPNSRIMIHQPSGGARGTASDIEVQAKEIKYLKKRLYTILSKATGKSEEKILADCDRDYFMSAEEAKEYGLIDHVIEKLNSKVSS